VSNGHNTLSGVDQRSLAARRYREIIVDVVNDMGGNDNVTAQQLMLVRRASGINLLCEEIETRVVNGETVAPQTVQRYAMLARTQATVLRDLGLQRRARDVTPIPDAHDYLDPNSTVLDGVSNHDQEEK
jgi:hypothetical protein